MVGDIALALFPFTSLQDAKIRPVLVVADVGVSPANRTGWFARSPASSCRADVRTDLPIADARFSLWPTATPAAGFVPDRDNDPKRNRSSRAP